MNVLVSRAFVPSVAKAPLFVPSAPVGVPPTFVAQFVPDVQANSDDVVTAPGRFVVASIAFGKMALDKPVTALAAHLTVTTSLTWNSEAVSVRVTPTGHRPTLLASSVSKLSVPTAPVTPMQ